MERDPRLPDSPSSGPHYFDALSALYGAELAALRTLSERSFATTLQALTLDSVVVAGLVGGNLQLSLVGKLLGSGVLLAFHVAVGSYLISKSRAHHREKKKLVVVERELAELAGSPFGKARVTEPSFWRSFLGGSGLMIVCVALGGGCALAGLWMNLLK